VAEKHPYSPAGAGGIVAAVIQLRKSFPAKVTSETLKKLGIAPNAESYVINVLRFLGVVDAEGNKTQTSTNVFSKHNDADFHQGFEKMVKTAYSELFGLHGDGAWKLSIDELISFFRHTDQTSALTGRRQAIAFQALASLAGQGEAPAAPKPKQPKEAKTTNGKPKQAKVIAPTPPSASPSQSGSMQQPRGDFGLTVRIEVNLPTAADQDTYDRIFRSIRENLLNGK
jgi:hypothetical protein